MSGPLEAQWTTEVLGVLSLLSLSKARFFAMPIVSVGGLDAGGSGGASSYRELAL